MQRRARVHKETELDSAVSSKFFGDIADGFESLGDAVGDTFEDIGEGIASVGLTVGSHVGNAAMVVGNSVVDVAESTVNALPAAIKDAANSLGNAVVPGRGLFLLMPIDNIHLHNDNISKTQFRYII